MEMKHSHKPLLMGKRTMMTHETQTGGIWRTGASGTIYGRLGTVQNTLIITM